MKRYAELIGNYKIQWIKSHWDNNLVCDEDYTGEYIIAVHNDTDEMMSIEPGDRIAQLVFLPYLPVEFEEVESLNVTDRGSNGFGSSGR